MITVGIDKLSMYTSQYAMDLATLAKARGTDVDKYRVGLGQLTMSVPPPGEDIVTMAANASKVALEDIDINSIEMVLFATESGIDQSKAAAVYMHELLSLPANCRSFELKQACYGATAALQLCLPFLRENPEKKILLIASDIARYGLQTAGESSQGSGAIAMILSAQPRLLAFESGYGVVTESVMDFWRPNYRYEAFVDGKYSSKLYLTILEKCWQHYRLATKREYKDHDYFCYHTPVPRLVEKAHQHLRKINGLTATDGSELQSALHYSRQTGNTYTASLYISLLSLLEQTNQDLSGKRVGFYSYGSGCVAEYFSGIIQPSYQTVLNREYHQQLLSKRSLLSYEQYEAFYLFKYREDGQEQSIAEFNTGAHRIAKLEQHKRFYAKTSVATQIPYVAKKKFTEATPTESIRVYAPAKLILSGEHAVVYGNPALAMAINRFATATVTRDTSSQVSFDLTDLAHNSRLTLNALRHLKHKLKDKYYRFVRGDFSIRDVLQKPFELAQFALGVLAEALDMPMPQGVKIHLQSNIPIGCGLGSSAATILSVMQAMANFSNVSLSNETMFKLALEAENMQHGHSSGLDLQVALQGGCLYMQGDKLEKRNLPNMPLYLVNTGTPSTTTGECIEDVAKHFQSVQLKDEFAAVLAAMDAALYQQSWPQMQAAIRENHKLLTRIGVVPEKVQQFIHHVEMMDGAAKICGAGSVSGNNAGAVLVASEDNQAIVRLCERYSYSITPIAGEQRGVHAA